MKPRLEPAPPTKEDFEILCYTWPGRDWRRDPLYPIGHSISADRRDADLVYELMKGRKTFRESRRSYERLRRYALSIGGTNRDWPE